MIQKSELEQEKNYWNIKKLIKKRLTHIKKSILLY